MIVKFSSANSAALTALEDAITAEPMIVIAILSEYLKRVAMEEGAFDICLLSKTVGRKYRPTNRSWLRLRRSRRCTTVTLKLNDFQCSRVMLTQGSGSGVMPRNKFAARSSSDRPKRRPFGFAMSLAVQRKVDSLSILPRLSAATRKPACPCAEHYRSLIVPHAPARCV